MSVSLLSGCASLDAVQRGDLSLLLPEAFSNQKVEAYSATGPNWSDSFPSKDLVDALARVRAENKSLAAARARIQQRLAEQGISEAALWPELNLEPEFERKRERTDGGASDVSNTVTLGGSLSWELDVWGRLRSLEAASALSVQEERALLEQTVLNLQFALVQNWISAITASRLENVILAQQETNRQFLSLTELRLSQGQGSALDVLLQRGRLLATERELPPIQAETQRARNSYAVLVGMYPDATYAIDDDLRSMPDISALPSPYQLLARRPDLRAAQYRLLKVDQEVAAAVADRLPRLSIGLNYNVSGADVGDLGAGRLLSFTTGFLAPIFDGGRRLAEVKKRRAEALEALSDLEQAMLLAVQEIEDALVTESASLEERRLLRREIKVSQQSVESARTRYLNGQVSYLTILDSLERLQSLRKREIRLEQSIASNRATLLVALGSTWELDDEK